MKFRIRSRWAKYAFLMISVSMVASIPLIWIASRLAADQKRNPYLDRVVEPIRIENGFSFDDGGSMGLIFRDDAGVEFMICLENSLWDESDWRDDGRKNLILGSALPGKEELRVTIGGSEEKQLLRILKRWTEYDETGRAIEVAHKKLRGTPAFSNAIRKYEDSHRPQVIAWGIYNRLRSPSRRSDSLIRRLYLQFNPFS